MIGRLYKVDRHLLWVAVTGSLLLSLWAYYADDVINNDGIGYVRAAEEFARGEWRYAVQTYKWPFYSGFIALTSLASGISLEKSALLLNAVFFVLLVISFVTVVRVLGGGRAVLWIALLVVLFHPAVNKFRAFIIRDPGYLAFVFAGLYGFFTYLKDGGRRYNVAAVSCFLLATLFRVEGMIFLAVSQYLALTHGPRPLIGRRAATVLLLAAAAAMFVLLVWWNFEPTREMDHTAILEQPVRFLQAAWSQLAGGIGERLAGIRDLLLVKYSSGYAVFLFVAITFTILVAEIVNSTGVIYAFLALYGWRYGLLFPRHGLLRPWAALVLVNALFLYMFVFLQWFMTDRYPLAVTLLLLLAAPFVLHFLYHRLWLGGVGAKRTLFGALVLVLALGGIKGLDLFTGKSYIKAAGLWLRDNAPPGASVYTNNRILAFYAGRGLKVHFDRYRKNWKSYKFRARVARKRYDYLALRVKSEEQPFSARLPVVLGETPVAVFSKGDGSEVLIFHTTGRGRHEK